MPFDDGSDNRAVRCLRCGYETRAGVAACPGCYAPMPSSQASEQPKTKDVLRKREKPAPREREPIDLISAVSEPPVAVEPEFPAAPETVVEPAQTPTVLEPPVEPQPEPLAPKKLRVRAPKVKPQAVEPRLERAPRLGLGRTFRKCLLIPVLPFRLVFVIARAVARATRAAAVAIGRAIATAVRAVGRRLLWFLKSLLFVLLWPFRQIVRGLVAIELAVARGVIQLGRLMARAWRGVIAGVAAICRMPFLFLRLLVLALLWPFRQAIRGVVAVARAISWLGKHLGRFVVSVVKAVGGGLLWFLKNLVFLLLWPPRMLITGVIVVARAIVRALWAICVMPIRFVGGVYSVTMKGFHKTFGLLGRRRKAQRTDEAEPVSVAAAERLDEFENDLLTRVARKEQIEVWADQLAELNKETEDALAAVMAGDISQNAEVKERVEAITSAIQEDALRIAELKDNPYSLYWTLWLKDEREIMAADISSLIQAIGASESALGGLAEIKDRYQAADPEFYSHFGSLVLAYDLYPPRSIRALAEKSGLQRCGRALAA